MSKGNRKIDINRIVLVGLLIALQVIFTRLLSIQLPAIRIGIGFLPLAICSMMFGPLIGGLSAVLADILGMFFLNTSGSGYFPGFSVSAFLTGAIYGLVLYKQPKTWLRIGVAVGLVSVFINLFLNTLWLKIILGKGFFALLPGRVIDEVVMFPISVVLIYVIWKWVITPMGYEGRGR